MNTIRGKEFNDLDLGNISFSSVYKYLETQSCTEFSEFCNGTLKKETFYS